jgi:hypothetical protein
LNGIFERHIEERALNEKPELWKEEFVISSRRQIWKLLAMEQE